MHELRKVKNFWGREDKRLNEEWKSIQRQAGSSVFNCCFLLVFCLFAGPIRHMEQRGKHMPRRGTLTESVNLEGVVYKEIEPGKMQLVEWAKNISWKEVIEIPETVTYDGKEYTVVSIEIMHFTTMLESKSIAEVVFPDTIESIGGKCILFLHRYELIKFAPELKKKLGIQPFELLCRWGIDDSCVCYPDWG